MEACRECETLLWDSQEWCLTLVFGETVMTCTFSDGDLTFYLLWLGGSAACDKILWIKRLEGLDCRR